MIQFIKSKIRGLITQFKRRNYRKYYFAGACVRMFIERETQKTWVNLDGSYVMLPEWYIEKR